MKYRIYGASLSQSNRFYFLTSTCGSFG